MKTLHGNLLVVDDERLNALLIAEQLKDHGHTFTLVDSGEKAIEAISQQSFDAVLLDIMMPGIDGFEVLRRVRQTYTLAELPVILVTAMTQQKDIVAGMSLGANDYLTKPIDHEELLARLQTQLSLKQSHADKFEAEQALKKQLSQRNALLKISQSVQEMTQPSDLVNVLKECLNQGKNIGLNAQSMAIHRRVDPKKEIVETFRVCIDSIMPKPERKVSTQGSANWQAGRIVCETDIEKSMPLEKVEKLRNRYGGLQIRSLVNIPFSKGTLSVHSTDTNAFQDSDIETLKQVAETLSVGLTRLDDLENLEDRGLQLEEKDELIHAFHEIGKLTLSSLNLDQILANLANQIVSEKIFRSLSISLLNENADSVEMVLSKHERKNRIVDGETSRAVALDSSDILAEVVRNGRLEIIEGWDEKRYTNHTDLTRDQLQEIYRGKVAYFIPIKQQDKVLGVLATGSKTEDREAIVHRIGLMSPLIDQIAIAIEHARLYQAGQEHAQQLAAINLQLEQEAINREQAEAHFRNLYEHSNDGIFVYNLEGVLQDVNTQFCKMLNYSPEELLGHFVSDFRPTALDDFIEGIYRELLEKKSVRFESQFIKKDGTIIDVGISASIFDETKGLGQAIVRDITVQSKTAATLRESEERFRRLFEQSNDGVFIHDLDGRIVDLNSRACEMLGYTRDDLLFKNLSNFRSGDLEVQAEEAFQRFLKDGAARFEFQFIHKNGHHIDVDISSRFVDREKGLIQGVVRDITDRKKAESELQFQNAQLSAQQEATIDGILVIDGKGNWISYNQQLIDLWGFPTEITETMSSEIALEWALNRLVNPDKFIEKVRYLYDHPHEKSRDEIDLTDGRILDRYSAPLQGEDGQYYGRIWSFRDITNVKKVEETLRDTNEMLEKRVAERTAALQESEEKFRTLIEHAADALFVHDDEGKFVEVNQRACDSLGYTQEELLQLSVPNVDANFGQDNIVALVEPLLPGDFVTVEGIHIRKDGSRFPVEVRVGRFELGDRTLMLALARDVTERKRLEEQLLQAQKMEAIGKLAGGIAHDFNNLLTVINGYSKASLKSLAEHDPQRSNLELIQNAGQRAASLTRQLLAFSRRQMLQPKVVNVNEIVVNIQKMLHRLIGEDIDLSVILNTTGQVKIDPGQMDQVLMNLTVNARDAMPEGGQLIIETQDIILDDHFVNQYENMLPGNYIMLSVKDTGCGIAPDSLDRIFEPFFTTKEQGKGTGLGLSTAYGIMAQSGGCLTVHSIEGQGTTFKAYLPKLSPSLEMEKAESPEEELIEGDETILLVEDEDMVRTFTQHTLQDLGYNVLPAENGEAALRIFKQHQGQIDLLLTDVVMPHMNGKELADRLLAEYPTLEVIYMSGYTDDRIHEQGVLDPGVAYLQKPFDPEKLSEIIRQVLDD